VGPTEYEPETFSEDVRWIEQALDHVMSLAVLNLIAEDGLLIKQVNTFKSKIKLQY